MIQLTAMQPYLVVLARVLIAVLFLYAAVCNTRAWKGLRTVMRQKKIPFAGFLVSIGIIFETIAAILIILGIYIPIVALLLIPFTLVSILIYHDFWNKPEGEVRSLNQGLFVTHLTTTLSALILLIVVSS